MVRPPEPPAPQAPQTDRYVRTDMTPPKGAGAGARASETSKPVNNTGKGWFAPGNQGRPPTYRPEAATFAEQGATQAEIAAALGCTIRTVSRWRLAYADFREALDRGRKRRAVEQADAALAREIEAQRPAREAALALEEMLKGILAAPAKAPAESTSARQPLPGTQEPSDPSDAPDEAASRISERRALRQRREPTAEEPEGSDDGDGEPVPMEDPRSEW
ncbi:helix-turn-helix domain-containing protein [Mesorhizobium sp. M1136]|uniref:helix-turn-helix domain-containing protein n=1 Tax=Mesorhizobium sp. M1136 TaxID=2957059 RepID=UPI00333D634A